MDTPKTELPRRIGRMAVGALVAAGVAFAAASPAMADKWHNNGHGGWKHHRGDAYYSQGYYPQGYYYQPQVVYVQPPPVYVQPAPVYVAPPPPPVYYAPAPVYAAPPQLNIIVPLKF